MMYKAGINSYYGASVMTNFAEYVKINDYTEKKINDTLINPKDILEIESAPYWYDDEDEKIVTTLAFGEIEEACNTTHYKEVKHEANEQGIEVAHVTDYYAHKCGGFNGLNHVAQGVHDIAKLVAEHSHDILVGNGSGCL